MIRGEDAFELHDTRGFQLELVVFYAHERGLGVDIPGFMRVAISKGWKRARAISVAVEALRETEGSKYAEGARWMLERMFP